jgi:hypothetical protein
LTAPNLFDYATTELSQDAFVCWMLAWADECATAADPTMHQAGLDLLNALLGLHGQPRCGHVRIRLHKQLFDADIVAEVGERLVLLIEDKIHAGPHTGQFTSFPERISRHFTDRKILPIFFKTGDQSNYEEVEKAGYKCFLRKDLLQILRFWRGKVSNGIFVDFTDNLERRHAKIESYANEWVAVWTKNWDPWVGFYMRLQDEIRLS